MVENIAFENGRISDFQDLVTLTLTLDWVILHTFMHHSSTSTCIPNFIEIEETFCGRTDVRTGGRTFETHFIRSTPRSLFKKKALKEAAAERQCLPHWTTFQIIVISLKWSDVCSVFDDNKSSQFLIVYHRINYIISEQSITLLGVIREYMKIPLLFSEKSFIKLTPSE